MKYGGVWERKGRNPLVAAFLLVIALGALYSLVQSLALGGYVFVDALRGGSRTEGGAQGGLAAFAELYRRYRPAILAVLAVTQYGIFLLPPLALVRRWHTPEVGPYLRFSSFTWPGLAVSLLGTVLMLPAVLGIVQGLYSLFPGLERWSEAMEAFIVAPEPAQLALTLFVIAFTPALCEEVLFRGYLQRTLERRLSAPWHFLLSGAVFALFHQQVLSLPSLFLVGIFLGYLFYRFRSIYLTMLAHFLYNCLVILLANFRPSGGVLFEAEGSFRLPVVGASVLLFALTVLAAELLAARSASRRPTPERWRG